MADLSSICGTIQVFVAGLYDGTLNDFSFTDPRPITQTGMANRKVARGIGIGKPTVSFSRPMLQTSKGQQVSTEVLNGPVDIDVIFPGGDQQWRLPRFERSNRAVAHNPEAGNTSEKFEGICDAPLRIK